MRFHDRIMIADFPASLPEITNQFFAAIELRPGWLVAVEIADQTNSERDVVQIIAVNVAAVDLSPPTIAHFDLTVAGRSSIADHEMISKAVLHPAKMPVVIIECGRVSLTRSAVVHDDVLPATPRNRCAIDLGAHGAGQIAITGAAAGAALAATK